MFKFQSRISDISTYMASSDFSINAENVERYFDRIALSVNEKVNLHINEFMKVNLYIREYRNVLNMLHNSGVGINFNYLHFEEKIIC